ncbi:glycine cleavage system aminomethyltransferase GcvT [Caenispirillum bisanense]|uniref:glycine cleavage system aminomethyltransferase GcvT n=1 Tax=Caenispirillum bisanense TaxID=414052 RepID=UPI0031D5FB96
MSDTPAAGDALRTTPLDSLHRELGAKMVPFAGYSMPVQYPMGILNEHLHTRAHAGLFDVSHMGQCRLTGSSVEAVARALETLVPSNILELKPGRQRYTLFTDDAGGILDDLMVSNAGDCLMLVVNAACKEADFAHLKRHLEPQGVTVEVLEDRALLALQGPGAARVMEHLAPASAAMTFMSAGKLEVAGVPCFVTRSGYTGEDGFEISVPADQAEHLARHILEQPDVAPVGLGARDSLRLEAGLCLYGSDIDTTTTPVEGALVWAMQKRRREEGGFPGADVIRRQLADGVGRTRVGILPEGKAPARAHTEIQDDSGRRIGEITSGGFGPTVGGPVAMGYVETAFAEPGTAVTLLVRGKPLPARVVALPFVEQRYYRG